ncbi:MAG: hypothetical protein EDM79_17535 [Chloroflexi bacterium]|nr:MAG: hypothetical protein EDM79_17535 [Chloroflexota bacterium]
MDVHKMVGTGLNYPLVTNQLKSINFHDICYSHKTGINHKIGLSLETEWQHTGAHARLATQDLTHTQIKEKK